MTGPRGPTATAHWLATVTLEWPAAQATLLDARGAIDALSSPPRPARARDHRAAARLAMDGPGRTVALPARDRHADRGRAVRRDRRLRTVRQSRAADELRRTGPLRVHDRPATPARLDHQDRVRARPPAAGRGRLALPHPPQRSARHSATAKTASHPRRSRSPGQPNDACTAPGHASKHARNAARSSPSPPPANSPASAGRSPESSERHRQHIIPSTGPVAARHARGTRDAAMSNPPPRGWPRPILDSGSPRRTMVLRHPTREYQPDRASRTASRTATRPADHTTHTNAKREKSPPPT